MDLSTNRISDSFMYDTKRRIYLDSCMRGIRNFPTFGFPISNLPSSRCLATLNVIQVSVC